MGFSSRGIGIAMELGRMTAQARCPLRGLEPWSKLLILPNSVVHGSGVMILSVGGIQRDGGGGRIRTFEVCDGRFTVCSLWPLGNPTMVFMVANFEQKVGKVFLVVLIHPSLWPRLRW